MDVDTGGVGTFAGIRLGRGDAGAGEYDEALLPESLSLLPPDSISLGAVPGRGLGGDLRR